MTEVSKLAAQSKSLEDIYGCEYCGRKGCYWNRHGEAVRQVTRELEFNRVVQNVRYV